MNEMLAALRAAMNIQRNLLDMHALGERVSSLNAVLTLKEMQEDHAKIGEFLRQCAVRLKEQSI